MHDRKLRDQFHFVIWIENKRKYVCCALLHCICIILRWSVLIILSLLQLLPHSTDILIEVYVSLGIVLHSFAFDAGREGYLSF